MIGVWESIDATCRFGLKLTAYVLIPIAICFITFSLCKRGLDVKHDLNEEVKNG